jgi:hypothetical protein
MHFNKSNTLASQTKVTRSHRATNREVAGITAEIVDLVDRTNGPVPLNRLDDQVPGFSAPDGPSWSYSRQLSTGEAVIWDGMTDAGYKALRREPRESWPAV